MRTMSSNINTNTTELIKIWRCKINVKKSYNWLLTIRFWEGKWGASWWRLETMSCATDGICRSLINISIRYLILDIKYWISSLKSFPAVLSKISTILVGREHICFLAIGISSVYEQRLEEKGKKTFLPFFFSWLCRNT